MVSCQSLPAAGIRNFLASDGPEEEVEWAGQLVCLSNVGLQRKWRMVTRPWTLGGTVDPSV